MKLSLVNRRTHMYIGLFVSPWVLMYALSTIAVNHRELLIKYYGDLAPKFEQEQEQTYKGDFAADATPQDMAKQIMEHLGFRGAYGVRGVAGGKSIIITRTDPIAPRRITYTPADGKLVVERQLFRTPFFLLGLHFRTGYQRPEAANDLWASSVDLTIFGMIFWVGSGLWMWWELKKTRRWGLVSIAAGVGLFGLFLITL